MSGFVALHREAFTHPILKDGDRFRAWFWLVSYAAWKPTRVDVSGEIVEIDRGQMCFSIRYLADAWGWPKSNVDRFLKRLETEEMLFLTRSKTGTATGTRTGTGQLIITIRNYSKYQDISEITGTATGTATGTEVGQQRDKEEQGNKETRLEEEAYASPSSAGEGAGDELPMGNLEPDHPAKPKRSPKAKRSVGVDTPIPEDFEPVLGPKAQRIVDGWPPGMLDREHFAFCSHATANGRLAKDWNAAFGTWIAKAEERRTSNGNQNSRGGAPRPDGRFGYDRAPAGFLRRALEPESGEVAQAAYGRDDRQTGSDGELPFAPARALPGA